MIIQQETNEATTASDDQLMATVANRQRVLEKPLTFETSTILNQVGPHDLSQLLQRVLQEMPQGQKEVIHLASKGMSWREIAAKKQEFPGNRENAASFGVAPAGY